MKEMQLQLIAPPGHKAALLKSLGRLQAPDNTATPNKAARALLQARYVDMADKPSRLRKQGEVWIRTLASSGAPQLFELALRLVKEHGLWLGDSSKSARGARLTRPAGAEAPAAKARPVRFDADAPPGRQFRAMARNCLAQICPNASHVAAGSVDAEQVHQLRVGLRRLRSLLRDASELAGHVPPHWEPALRATFQALGAHRDELDVSEAVKPQLEAAGAPLALPAGDDVPAPSLPSIVRATEFQVVLLECLAFTWLDKGSADIDARKVLARKMDSLHRRVLKDGRRFTALDADRQHRVRKRLKRLRYLGEFSAPLFGDKQVARFLAASAPAQDALGEHHDGLVALEKFKASTAKDARAWFGVGWLTAHQAQTALHCQHQLKALGEVRPFWR